jgi:adenine-specific DNA glycosylase
MTVGAAELLGWYDIARRDLPWRNPGFRAGLMPTLGRPSGSPVASSPHPFR